MSDHGGKDVILAVDDTPENMDVVKGALGDDNVIKAAINGMIALTISEKAPPNQILLDIQMPGMDGFEVMNRLQAVKAIQAVPVIFLTGESNSKIKQRAFEMGARGFVTKPIDAAVLSDMVTNILSSEEG